MCEMKVRISVDIFFLYICLIFHFCFLCHHTVLTILIFNLEAAVDMLGLIFRGNIFEDPRLDQT